VIFFLFYKKKQTNKTSKIIENATKNKASEKIHSNTIEVGFEYGRINKNRKKITSFGDENKKLIEKTKAEKMHSHL